MTFGVLYQSQALPEPPKALVKFGNLWKRDMSGVQFLQPSIIELSTRGKEGR